jgi:glycosyltransferase involved in cell wall biosynthesis
MVSSRNNLNNPIVSVCVQTYQHASYIRDALDGILMQKTDFAFEILLGEDESTDGTREICIEYAEKYHGKIRLFLNSRKNVIHINGLPTGRRNFMNNLKNARGKYIALLPGDDYWTDPHKLQKQVDFLEANPDFVICFHNVMVVHDENAGNSHPFHVQHPSGPIMQRKPKAVSTLEDLVRGNFIQTPSAMFRGLSELVLQSG